jgi:hypothetical protein
VTLARALEAARAAHAAIAGDPTMDGMRAHVGELARRARVIDTMKNRVVALAATDEIVAALRLVVVHAEGRGGPLRLTAGARGNAGDPVSVVLRELALRQDALAEVEGDALRATG